MTAGTTAKTLRPPLSDWSALAALVLMWGSAFALTKIAVDRIDPFWVTALRIAIGAVVLVVSARVLGYVLPVDRRAWIWFAALGFVGNVAPFVLIAWAQQHIASSLAGILVAMMPIMVIVLAHYVLPDEPLTRRKLASFGCGFAGVVLLVGPVALGGLTLGGIRLVAELAVLVAAGGYALNAIGARRAPEMPGIVLATGVVVAAVPQAILAALVFARWPDAPDTAAWIATVLLGVFPTAVAAAILYPLLQRAGASFVATSNYYVPCCAVLLGVAFLGERLAPLDYAGFAVILAGVAIAQWRGADARGS